MLSSSPLATHLATRIAELIELRTPYVQATVVRAQCPTSARPGDSAIVLADGTIEGFVGGQCAESSVRIAALDALAGGEALLLRILPEDDAEFPDTPGARTVVNPCLSGGALEVFLEPKRPAPRLTVIGNTPIANAIALLGQPLGFDVDQSAQGPGDPTGATAVVVASHGRAEPESLRTALDAGVHFVGLVASARRAESVLAELGLSDEERKVVHSPVGLPIGAKTAEEIALSVLSEIVREIRLGGLQPAAGAERAVPAEPPATAVDPVCGMTVVVGPQTPHLRVDGVDHWFCNPGCRTRFAQEQAVGAGPG
jgi:xanthine dehydrogenase accessory factor